MNEEILRIQRMVAEGKVSAEESVELIESLVPGTRVQVGSARRWHQDRATVARYGSRALLVCVACLALAYGLREGAAELRREIAQQDRMRLVGEKGDRSSWLPTLVFAARTGGDLFVIAAVAAGVLTVVLARTALSEKLFSGQGLTGWPRAQATLVSATVALASVYAALSALAGLACLGLSMIVFGTIDRLRDWQELAQGAAFTGALAVECLIVALFPGIVGGLLYGLCPAVAWNRRWIKGLLYLVAATGIVATVVLTVSSVRAA